MSFIHSGLAEGKTGDSETSEATVALLIYFIENVNSVIVFVYITSGCFMFMLFCLISSQRMIDPLC